MKFTDGNWLHRKGVRAHYAAEAYHVRAAEDGVTILAPCHPIRHRGDTLAGPVVTVPLSSPMADVIRVRLSHFEGVQDHGLLLRGGPPRTRTGGPPVPREEDRR
jgi:alpha-D-xyloside xylohydrolase